MLAKTRSFYGRLGRWRIVIKEIRTGNQNRLASSPAREFPRVALVLTWTGRFLTAGGSENLLVDKRLVTSLSPGLDKFPGNPRFFWPDS